MLKFAYLSAIIIIVLSYPDETAGPVRPGQGQVYFVNKTVSAVLVAAGSSTRMGFDKLRFDLGGESVLRRSVRAFEECPLVSEIVLVAGNNADWLRAETADCTKTVRIVRGGATRAESARNGVLAAKGELVAVHDAARPFVSRTVIEAALHEAAEWGAAAPAVPVKDTVKLAGAGNGKETPENCLVEATPDRNCLYAVQTPQCFDRQAYLAALDELPPEQFLRLTDDCSLFEQTGRTVRLTRGDYSNLKITTREDLPRPADKGVKQMRVGHGYDVHRLVEGRKLILGGVEIPFEKGLLGHSDADVLAHAVMDAVLGAAALGSGGVFGNGLFSGDYYSVPNAHNDFIFSWVGNALGFVGCMLVLGILIALVIRTFMVGARSEDLLGSFICAGVGGALLAQIAVNVGMNLRVLPVIGVTLPFYSAGGSSVLMLYICVGLVLSVHMHNKKKLFG